MAQATRLSVKSQQPHLYSENPSAPADPFQLDAQELNLTGQDLGKKGLQKLCDALQENTTVTTLILDHLTQPITVDDAALLANLLGTNKTITTLSLQYATIGSDQSLWASSFCLF